MFTGIVTATGRLARRVEQAGGARLTITTSLDLYDARLGDSIAVDGVCLTAVALPPGGFEVELGHETLARTTLGGRRIGSRVNLERALLATGRLDGHLVQGHVDALGEVVALTPRGTAVDWRFRVDSAEARELLVPKGSVAVDGISLTVNEVHDDGFSVSIIPHTAAVTALNERRPGDVVNLETDIIGRYVAHLLRRATGGAAADERLLRKLVEGGFTT